MTAVPVPLEELMRWLDPPALRHDELERLADRDVERLLVDRFRVFVGRGIDWRQALLLAVTPDG